MRRERLQQIEEYINENGFVTMEDIRDEFGIAMPTVRKDIGELVSQGSVEKVYGGAKARGGSNNKRHVYKNREGVRVEEKDIIAAKAAATIKDGDVIYLDSGTTAPMILKHLEAKHVFIITRNLAVANEALRVEDVDVYLMGGKINKETMSVDSDNMCEQIRMFNIDKAFMAATGYSIEGGVAQDSPLECEVKKYVLEMATDNFLIIDGSKIGRKALVRYANADHINNIITDGEVDEEYEVFFKENEINMI